VPKEVCDFLWQKEDRKMTLTKRVQGESNREVRAMAPVEEEQEERRTDKPARKTKFCMFHLQGVCLFGSECAFAHSVDELQHSPDPSQTRKDSESEEEAPPVDTPYKKKLCMWHERGRCRKGEQCRFAHGAEELRRNGDSRPVTGAESAVAKNAALQGLPTAPAPPVAREGNTTQRRNVKPSAGTGRAINSGGAVPAAYVERRSVNSLNSPAAIHGVPATVPRAVMGALCLEAAHRYEPMFVHTAKTMTPLPPPPGFMPQMAPQPVPEVEQQARYNGHVSAAMTGGTGSLVEGLRGLEEAPVEELRREWQMMEQMQRASEAAAFPTKGMGVAHADWTPGAVSQNLEMLNGNIKYLLQLQAEMQLHDPKLVGA
jgi:hypothetical protein